MIRKKYIELILRQIHGGMPNNETDITEGQVNAWLPAAIGAAAKQNYKENVQLDGIGYVSGSFYSKFKGIAVVKDENGLYKLTLPQIPLGIGASAGVEMLQFRSAQGEVSQSAIPLTNSQAGYHRNLRRMPNKIEYYLEGANVYVVTSLPLHQYTAIVSMISGGNSDDLTSEINVPDDYFEVISAYIAQKLLVEKSQPRDAANDGVMVK